MQVSSTAKSTAAETRGAIAHAEPINMRKRIGSTVYEVRVYFNQDAKETMDDKILRLIHNEALNGKAG